MNGEFLLTFLLTQYLNLMVLHQLIFQTLHLHIIYLILSLFNIQRGSNFILFVLIQFIYGYILLNLLIIFLIIKIKLIVSFFLQKVWLTPYSLCLSDWITLDVQFIFIVIANDSYHFHKFSSFIIWCFFVFLILKIWVRFFLLFKV